MANTFFGFDTSTLNNDSNLLPDDDPDLGEAEEYEYDALNDETFGGLGDSSALNDDWEEQHQQYAHYDENSKQSERIENSIRDLVLNDSDDDEALLSPTKPANWDYQRHLQQQQQEQELQHQRQQQQQQQQQNQQSEKEAIHLWGMDPNDIPTVEEIEKLCKLFAYKPPHRQRQQQHIITRQPPPPQQQQPPQRLPPGFLPPQMPVTQRQHPPGLPPPRMPPGFPCMPPMPGARQPGNFPPMPMLRPGMPPQCLPGPPQYGNFPNYPMPPPTIHNGPPPPGGPLPPHIQQQFSQQVMQHMQMQQQAQQHQQQRHVKHIEHQQQQMNNRYVNKNGNGQHMQHQHHQQLKDEYAGLMTNREKQWLLNIQQLQLNTGTPYFDDYYFTVFKERRARNDKENQPHHQQQMHDRRHHHHHHHQQQQQHQQHNQQQQRNRNHQQERNDNTMSARVYTPLQFENSLGKLQCISVTAPRKIIDTDVVTLEKDSESTPTRDTRKTKQLLLELESLYSLVLKAEDLLNPIAISNLEKLVEIKQKQRLREMEAAATSEQKQELLKLLQLESAPPNENPVEYLLKIMSGLLQEDKFASFMNIRKGKMLLLRLLPMLSTDYTIEEYAALWCKVLLCIPLIGRRDMAGDNLLLRLHPYFKRFVQTSRMHDILGIVGKLEQSIRQTDSRCTPLGHQSKAPLQFVVGNKFGVSALVTILVRTEYLLSSGNVTEAQVEDWLSFLQNWAEATNGRSIMASPMELIPRPVFVKHANRFERLTDEKRLLLEKHYVDIN